MFQNLSWGHSSKSSGGGRRGRPEREEAQKQQQREEEARAGENTCKKSDTNTEAGGEAGTSQSQYKKVYISNIYLTDSDEEAIVDFVKDHRELYDKNDKHFKD